MQPNYSSVGQLFSAQARYTVPLFQRPYVWNKEEQWQPLWDDVRALADRVLSPPAHKAVAGHFLGTVVLEQLKTPAIAMPQRQVIDGQQRLTTLQLLLKAAEHSLEIVGSKLADDAEKACQLASGQVAQLSRNQFAAEPEESYKVWPTNDDRGPFKAVMDSETATGPATQNTRMAEAYRFFRTVILSWLAGPDQGRRALAFAAALKDHLRLIVLDLDETDEPQAIFETLNAHGTPLLPADLMKNWLLWQAGKQAVQPATLYEQYWSMFDRGHDYWRKNIGTGHAARPRVDTFLQNWLTVVTLEPVSVKHLYDRFLAYANERRLAKSEELLDVEALMEEIHSNAHRYAKIDSPQGDTLLDTILRRLNRLDFVVFRPVLMSLMGRPGSDEADQILGSRAIESYLVRRMVCDMQTRGYGNLALDLVRAIRSLKEDELAAPALIERLSATPGDWPDDATFRHNWRTRRFYGWLRRDRVAMLLQAIEELYQATATKSEPVLKFDYSKLTIEHIMPQSWAANWPLPPGADISERDSLIQNVGNLTLVSQKLNPTLSNAAWVVDGTMNCKRAGLAAHSDLKMNKRLLAEHPTWNEEEIRARADKLFEAAALIWPAPQALAAQADHVQVSYSDI